VNDVAFAAVDVDTGTRPNESLQLAGVYMKNCDVSKVGGGDLVLS
jgi:hypothetical protein